MSNSTGKKVRRRAAGALKVGEGSSGTSVVVKGMTPALRSEYEKLKRLLASSEKQDVRTRYEIGRVVAQVRGERAKYGSDAVGKLERALGLDENTLRRYERIANTWTPTQVSTLLKRTNPYGRPLSWSHLDVLAEVVDEKKRESLLKQALREGLSVRELAKRVRGGTLSLVEDANESALSRPILSAVREMTARAENVVERVESWEKSVFERLKKENSPEVNESLQKAKGAFTQLRSVADLVLKHIEEGLAKADVNPTAVGRSRT